MEHVVERPGLYPRSSHPAQTDHTTSVDDQLERISDFILTRPGRLGGSNRFFYATTKHIDTDYRQITRWVRRLLHEPGDIAFRRPTRPFHTRWVVDFCDEDGGICLVSLVLGYHMTYASNDQAVPEVEKASVIVEKRKSDLKSRRQSNRLRLNQEGRVELDVVEVLHHLPSRSEGLRACDDGNIRDAASHNFHERVGENRTTDDRGELLGHRVCQRPQAPTLPTGENYGLHFGKARLQLDRQRAISPQTRQGSKCSRA